jgi:c-di-GMP-binding flagellar brake protein YcgR
MSDSAIVHLLKSIPDNQSATITCSTTIGQTVHIDCIYKEGMAPPRFFLVFPQGTLPKEINMSQQCLIAIHSQDEDTVPPSFNARIEEGINDHTLELTATKNVDPTALRDFFRVALYAPVTLTVAQESNKDSADQWLLKGETLDLSGSGTMALFDEEIQEGKQLQISLDLPSPQSSVSCLGHVVRARRVRRGRWQISLHFDNIANKLRDIIISNCLYAQRKELEKGLRPNS